jgi:hypothetical protein
LGGPLPSAGSCGKSPYGEKPENTAEMAGNCEKTQENGSKAGEQTASSHVF